MVNLTGTYCPPEEITIDWEMSKIRYAVIIQQMASRSINHIRIFGTVVSGNPRIDEVMAESDLHTEMSILKIVETWHSGKEIRIVHCKDLLKIYNVTNLFLKQWAEKIQKDFLGNVFPLEELSVLEQFADYLYHKCFDVGLKVVPPNELVEQYRKHGVTLDDLDSLIRETLGGNKKEVVTLEIPERESLEPFFDKSLDEQFKGGIFWNSEIAHSKEK